MIEDFYNHKCNIYHLNPTSVAVGFGFDEDDTAYGHSEVPDIEEQPCHFHTKTNSMALNQTEPENKLTITRKLSLPCGTDIRINDKVVDCDTGVEYTAELPINVKNHHISVLLIRTLGQEAL